MSAVLAAARSALWRRRRQTFIVGLVVFISTATGVLAMALLVQSHGPFDAAFAATRGSHMTVTLRDGVPAADLAASGKAAGVEAAAGPFAMVTARVETSGGGPRLPEGTIVGRAEQSGPVDQLTLDSGSWLTGPGQIVLARDYAGPAIRVGREVKVGKDGPTLKVVGIATSVTRTADGWVWPTQNEVLQQDSAMQQMLYRFTDNSTEQALRASLATATVSLPQDAVLTATSHLTVRVGVDRNLAAFVPFVVAFAVLGIVLSILITTNVVNGAVVSGFRTIGIQKTLGFTPRQVVGVYVIQVVVPAIVGSALGVVLGALLAVPLLGQAERAYDLPLRGVSVAWWIIALVLAAGPVLVALAAVGPASRAGRLPAVQAIAVGRAPRAGRGFRLRRALTATALPRPVALGLGLPLARPSRAVGTVVALLLGSVTLVFAVGLAASLARIQEAFTRVGSVPIVAAVLSLEDGGPMLGPEGGGPPPGGPRPPKVTSLSDPAAVRDKVLAMAGTRHAVLIKSADLRVTGISEPVEFQGYEGDGSWTGNTLISGRWYANAGEVVASSYLLRQTGYHVGDKLTFTDGRAVTIVGEHLDGENGYSVLGDASLAPQGYRVHIEIGLVPGTDPNAYTRELQDAYPIEAGVFVDDRTQDSEEETFIVLNALIGLLTLLVCSVAAVGVLNTVVLTTRERIHDIGVLKAIGMTPRQTRLMVVTSMVGLGLLAGAIAVPFGVALQRTILPIMGDGAGTGLPSSVLDVYSPLLLVALGCVGVVLAVAGALLPAGWAARTNVAAALRAE